jgi:hypothetical protein
VHKFLIFASKLGIFALNLGPLKAGVVGNREVWELQPLATAALFLSTNPTFLSNPCIVFGVKLLMEG